MMTLGQITGSEEFIRDAMNSIKDKEATAWGSKESSSSGTRHSLLGRISEERIPSP